MRSTRNFITINNFCSQNLPIILCLRFLDLHCGFSGNKRAMCQHISLIIFYMKISNKQTNTVTCERFRENSTYKSIKKFKCQSILYKVYKNKAVFFILSC